MLKLQEYWSLRDQPFADDTNPQYYYNSIFHEEALERMKYVIYSPSTNIGLLTGEIGAGKTTTRNRLIEFLEFDDKVHYCVSLDSSEFQFLDILFEVVSQTTDINISDLPRNKYKLLNIFKEFIKTRLKVEEFDILIFLDEIQKIPPKVLDSLKDLTNIRFNYFAPIKLFLIGQPEFINTIKKIPQVDQRIGMRFHLPHLTLQETQKYINHRLKCVTDRENIFTDEACKYIYKNTSGIPREINRACLIALEYAFAENISIISEIEMQVIFDDIQESNLPNDR